MSCGNGRYGMKSGIEAQNSVPLLLYILLMVIGDDKIRIKWHSDVAIYFHGLVKYTEIDKLTAV